MRSAFHIELVRKGADAWNSWRLTNNSAPVDFRDLQLLLSENSYISFSGFNFGDNVIFSGTRFPSEISFEGAVFGDNVSFRNCSFQSKVDFSNCRFGHYSDFQASIFEDEAIFKSTVFGDDANFTEAEFAGRAHFDESTFGKYLYFYSCKFLADAEFRRCNFGSETKFIACQFHNGAVFYQSVFDIGCDFVESNFYHMTLFDECVFNFVDFNGALGDKKDRAIFDFVSFEHTHFKGESSFKNRVFSNGARFVYSRFERAPVFHNSDLHQDSDFYGAAFEDFESEDAERAYRTLKLAMNKHHAHAEEMMFFALEMRARRYSEPWHNAWIFWLYEVLSNYGQSIRRPIIGLLCVFFFFTVIYWLTKFGGKPFPKWEDASNILAFSFSRTLPFLIPTMPQIASFTLDVTPFNQVLLVGVHSLASGVLIFLLGLGIRNRFRLKS